LDVVSDMVSCILPDASIVSCSDSIEAVSIFRDNDFSIVLADYRMPKQNGLKTINLLQAEHSKKGPKKTCHFFIITGAANQEVWNAQNEKKIDGILLKPASLESIGELFFPVK
jgi:CheY-like chemotaxis protein